MELKLKIIVTLLCIAGCFANILQHLRHHLMYTYMVNGTAAKPGTHMHMVALTLRSGPELDYVCGGSLITKRTVLTAAHCIEEVVTDGVLDKNLGITLGTNRWASGGTTYSVARNVTHPLYDPKTLKNDIGLLITAEDVDLTDYVQTIVLTFDYITEGIMAKVTGWGSNGFNDSSPEYLQELYVPTISGDKCVEEARNASQRLNMTYGGLNPQIELCTLEDPGLGTCVGDSGSPLTRLSDGQQIGIVSWGFPCALGAPDVFTRISFYADWLKTHMV